MNVVVSHQGHPYSLLVDDVGDVIDVPESQVKDVPVTLDPRWQQALTGVFAGAERLTLLVDVAAVLDLAASDRRSG
jgi:purine-binding chemotaxis protein CheW